MLKTLVDQCCQFEFDPLMNAKPVETFSNICLVALYHRRRMPSCYTVVLYEYYEMNEEVLILQLKKYDQEPEACRGKLFEYDVTFPPR